MKNNVFRLTDECKFSLFGGLEQSDIDRGAWTVIDGEGRERCLGLGIDGEDVPEITWRRQLLNARPVAQGPIRYLGARGDYKGILVVIQPHVIRFEGETLDSRLRWNAGGEGVRSNGKLWLPFFQTGRPRDTQKTQVFAMLPGDVLYISDPNQVVMRLSWGQKGFFRRRATARELAEQIVLYVKWSRAEQKGFEGAQYWGLQMLDVLGENGLAEQIR